MPGGEGAFAYVAVSLAPTEPKWLGGAEGYKSIIQNQNNFFIFNFFRAFDRKMQEKFEEYCPEPNEMEKILARRKDPKERQKALTFYDVLLRNISDELDGKLS